MEKRVKLRDQLLKIVLGIALLIGIYFSFQQTFPPILNNSGRAVQELYIWVSIISMFAGFVNIYMTTKRDVKFIYPDLVNLITTIIALFLAQTYSMLPMSFWGIIVAFIQYFDWKNHHTDDGQTQLKRIDKQAIMILILGVVIAFVIIGFLILIGHEGQGLLSGAFTTGTGLIASFLLAKRYFMAEYLFFLLNVLMLTTYLISGQFTLLIIPMVYFANNIIFLVFNRVSDYE
ncbi:nicotinamide mononucleotide transporter [Pediococcus acidilactici]|uniref:nicotinamide mononucleotide transporter n=1 Tax=Pediococcus acidilactici TaxID=1254 RepID=UPI00232B73AA|nr:nicotinamide mononucleotide transporter [Pediococcus acidilactici]MDB8861690.1 nicotinamide mononucleotide transporter [Pediococcus acidilactici]MDB8863480.1 nicotinamide mononucleotide transporter [Pediococcus acidilactici]